MKKIKYLKYLFLIIVFIFFVSGCKKEKIKIEKQEIIIQDKKIKVWFLYETKEKEAYEVSINSTLKEFPKE